MKNKSRKKKIFLGIAIIVLLILIAGSLELLRILKDLPHPEKITDFAQAQSTKIYDTTGKVLLYQIGGDNRTVVSGDLISPYIKEAIIAAEDQNFYQHPVLDIKGTFRAALVDLWHREFVQGGSTITQQLVKNVFLTSQKTIERKVKELILAYWIEQHYSKDDILTMYLNQIPFGYNASGIQAASQRFFGVDASALSIAQAATLAAVVQAPSYYSPWGQHVDKLKERTAYVLNQMRSIGSITEQQYAQARDEKLTFLSQNIGSIQAPHFVMMVKNYLENTYGEAVVENGGLTVVTTLDVAMQKNAEQAVADGAARNKDLYKGSNAALVAQDPTTGAIKALVGSADYFSTSIDGNYNVAADGLRQPGSTFKPFVYVTAFEKGYTPDTIVFDTPTEFGTDRTQCPLVPDFSSINASGYPCFHPQNFDHTFRGPVSLKDALAQSINVPAVKVLYLAGIPDSIRTAASMGIGTLGDPDKSQYGLSLVLGGAGVHLTDLVGAYSVFANDGTKHDQYFIQSVHDSRNNTLEQHIDVATQVLEPEYPRLINKILSDASLRAPLFGASLSQTVFSGYDVAMKTGTTNDYRDAWTVGYTPSLTVGVWAGNNNNTPMQRSGGSILAAVPIWSAFMNKTLPLIQSPSFVQPDPFTSSRPMLNGQYITTSTANVPQIHSILYYEDKNNPTQDPGPNYNPNNDPQFQGWETGVVSWAEKNIPNFLTLYNH
ncbi:MAG: PBP1A family penicillin-binding protein [Candidatus Paceibacterota bacterium]|jgi:1A family penicillin-binding protein